MDGGRVQRRAARLAIAAFSFAASMGCHAIAGGKPAAEKAPAHGAAAPEAAALPPLVQRRPPAPLFTVRPLATLREQVVRGSGQSLHGVGVSVETAGTELARFDMAVWEDARNRLALVSHTLGGGNPALLRKVAEADRFADEEKPLARGALAYAEGYFDAAAAFLDKVDVDTLPAALAGRVALVKAVMLSRSDAEAALAMCRVARFISPGTIVEEAALRLSIELAATAGDTKAFREGIDRLVWRFPRTPYLTSIVGQIAAYVAGRDEFLATDAAAWLEKVTGALAPGPRATLVEQIADGALRSGRYGLVLAATRIGVEGATADVRHRLNVYGAAAFAATGDSARASSLAGAVEASQLPPALAETLRMAKLVEALLSAPASEFRPSRDGEDAAAAAGGADRSPAETSWTAAFRKRVGAIDAALRETRR